MTGNYHELENIISSLQKENIANAFTFLCAQPAVELALQTAKNCGANVSSFLKYMNSGDTEIGDKTKVVGYAAIGFFSPKKGNELNQEEQEKLLAIAKTSVETYVKEGKILEFKIDEPSLSKKLGAFVTLKEKGQLRGCIGRFSPTNIPLYEVVSQMAIAAAVQDRRFSPVSKEELRELEYEISVLSPLKKINDPKEIELGKHGVEIKKSSKSGVFLPQVATENNWDLEKFMGELCSQKAGLAWDCWKQKDTEIYVFTVQVFGAAEEETHSPIQ